MFITLSAVKGWRCCLSYFPIPICFMYVALSQNSHSSIITPFFAMLHCTHINGKFLAGWVRNMQDGRVEAVFEGEDENVDKMLAWCHIGPPYARVENVMIKEEPYTGEFRDFSIKY